MTPPIALVVNIVAWVQNKNRLAAIAGAVISGAIVLLIVFGMVMSFLCR